MLKIPHVMIIDDEEDLGEILADYLGDGFTTTVCCDPAEAMALLSRHSYDLVISDLQMPKYSGFDIIAHAAQLSPPPPVVLLTGRSASDPLVRDALAKGAKGFISKPLPLPAAVLSYLQAILAAPHTETPP